MGNATENIREGRPNFREDIKFFIGLPKQPLLEVSPAVGLYRVKSVSLFRFTRFLQGQISLPFSIYSVITWSNRSPFLIYKVFTGSNRSLFSDLQGFYRVKSVSLFRFTRFLQGQISLPFSIYSVITWSNRSPFLIYKVFTGSNRSLFFDLQCYYRVK